jgi:hypothetical protein
MNNQKLIPSPFWPRRILLGLMCALTLLFVAVTVEITFSRGADSWAYGAISHPYSLRALFVFVGLCFALVAYDMVITKRRLKIRLAEINAQIASIGSAPSPTVPDKAPEQANWTLKRVLIEAFGWYGAAGLLAAYLLSSFGILHPDQVLYQVLNITAAIGIVTVSLSKKNYQPAVLDIIWATVGIISLVRILFF